MALRPCFAAAPTALLVLAMTAPAAAGASAADVYYERAVMSAADENCRLFTPELGEALGAARAQARGAALRSGVGTALLDQVAERARRRVARTPCNSPDVAKAAARVRTAFEGYSRLQKMSFPGDAASWAADRAMSRDVSRWRLWQTTTFGPDRLTFGLAGRGERTGLLAVAALADGAQPYAARLVMRDAARAPEPFLNLARAGAADRASMPSRLPPRSATLSILAQARDAADPSLTPRGAATSGGTGGVAFRFPAYAADKLAALDPRETAVLELLFIDAGGREQVRAAYIEIGDFAAGQAFLGAARR